MLHLSIYNLSSPLQCATQQRIPLQKQNAYPSALPTKLYCQSSPRSMMRHEQSSTSSPPHDYMFMVVVKQSFLHVGTFLDHLPKGKNRAIYCFISVIRTRLTSRLMSSYVMQYYVFYLTHKFVVMVKIKDKNDSHACKGD